MDNWLSNKKIVVIGGTSGIGLSAAKSFVRHGATVVAVGVDPESCKEAEVELGEQGIVLAGDARAEDTANTAIQKCLSDFGGFDGLFHVAGGSGRRFGDGPLHELTKDAWNQTFDLNLTSLMLSNKAAVRTWLDLKQGGSILNIASVLGFSPSPSYFTTHAYAAAKSAVFGLTKSIASYYAAHDIRVNALAPGLVKTPMSTRAATDEKILSFVRTKQPLDGGRMGNPDDLDSAAVYFMSDASKFTTGQILSIDGGWSISEGQMNPIF